MCNLDQELLFTKTLPPQKSILRSQNMVDLSKKNEVKRLETH